MNDEIIAIKVPYTEFLIQEGYTSLNCKSQGPNDDDPVMTACTLEIDIDFFTIKYAASCPTDNDPVGCFIYSPFSLYVTEGLQNINWIVDNPGNSIEITTYTEDLAYIIDTKTTGIYA